MKKFNATGVFRKDTKKEYDAKDLSTDLKGMSLEDAKRSLDDTTVLTEEELEEVKARMELHEEGQEIHR